MIEYAKVDLIAGDEGNDGKCQGFSDVSFLVGSTIKMAGYVPLHSEGGFAIDYCKNDNGIKEMRVVFGYNDLGFWVQWHGEINTINKKCELWKKIDAKWDYVCCQRPVLVDNPLQRSFSFTDGKNPSTAFLTLSIEEIKLMGEIVARHFEEEEKDVDKIVGAIAGWMSLFD